MIKLDFRTILFMMLVSIFVSCNKDTSETQDDANDIVVHTRNDTYNFTSYGTYFTNLYNHMFDDYGMDLCACNCQSFDLAIEGLNKYVYLLPEEMQYEERELNCEESADFANYGCSKEYSVFLEELRNLIQPQVFIDQEEISVINQIIDDAKDGVLDENSSYYRQEWNKIQVHSTRTKLASGLLVEFTLNSHEAYSSILEEHINNGDGDTQELIWHALTGLAVSYVSMLHNVYDNGGTTGDDFLEDAAWGFAYGAAGGI